MFDIYTLVTRISRLTYSITARQICALPAPQRVPSSMAYSTQSQLRVRSSPWTMPEMTR